jgi:ABC-2 type transport system permease protein
MGALLASRWLFFGLVGLAQITVMFLWGTAFFGLDLWTANHLVGFAVMAVFTAAAAAAFGIGLATLCTTRAQLGAISTIVILIMSALGGSMVPRFVMPSFMNTTALFTFNGWALDGFLDVFWFDDPAAGVGTTLVSILPEIAVLALMTLAFLGLARLFARRWEAS